MSKYFNMDGYVCGKVETRTSSNGKSVTRFTLNSPERFKDQGQWKTRPQFFKCQYWHRFDNDYRAGLIENKAHIQVTGEPHFDEWKDENGRTKSMVRFNVREILPIMNKSDVVIPDVVDESESVYDADIPF